MSDIVVATRQSHRSDAALHCCVAVEARYLAQAQPLGMVHALREAGCRVGLADPAESVLDVADAGWLDGVDVVIARGRSTALLARLSIAEAAGVPVVNSRSAISAVLDKAHMATQLQRAGVPRPATWIGSFAQVRQQVPDCAYPLILKPVFGDNCRGIQVVSTPAQLDGIRWTEPCVIAQELLPSTGFDVQLYAIGTQVWAVRKRSPLHGGGGAATLLPLPDAWRSLALQCAALFGLQLFGVDCIEVDGDLKVIEVNDFPNYTGVPEADFLLARHVVNARRARGGVQ